MGNIARYYHCVQKESMMISYCYTFNQPQNPLFSSVNWVIVSKISLFKLICRSQIDTKHVCNRIKTDVKNGKIVFRRLATKSTSWVFKTTPYKHQRNESCMIYHNMIRCILLFWYDITPFLTNPTHEDHLNNVMLSCKDVGIHFL